jgi:hypothetical protein
MLEGVVRDAEALGDIAPQVGVDGVAVPDEVLEHRPADGMAEVEGDASFVAVERLEEQRVLTVLVGRHIAAHVAAGARILDLDDVGAQVGEVQ